MIVTVMDRLRVRGPSIMGGTHAGFLPAVRARLVTRRRRRRRPWIIVSVLVSEFESQFKFKFRLLNLKFLKPGLGAH